MRIGNPHAFDDDRPARQKDETRDHLTVAGLIGGNSMAGESGRPAASNACTVQVIRVIEKTPAPNSGCRPCRGGLILTLRGPTIYETQ